MAHYALINNENIVVQVITGVDENLTQIDTDGTEVGGSAEAWEAFYASRPWFTGLKCKRTSYNSKIRKHFAGVDYYYDEARDAFIPPKPFDSWVLNEETCLWEAPVAYPNDPDNFYHWDDEIVNWVLEGPRSAI